jgi:hypothetical protein
MITRRKLTCMSVQVWPAWFCQVLVTKSFFVRQDRTRGEVQAIRVL